MKYIRTYETEEKFLTDKDSTSRGFRLKPTLYKYDSNGDHIHLEIDDPREHEGSTYMEITLDSDVEFSFYIGNAPGDTQTIRDCKVDWGDGTVETKTITADDKGFKLAHSYVAGSYKIELYMIGDYSIIGDDTNNKSLISHPSSVKRVVFGSGVVSIGVMGFTDCSSLTSVYIPESVTSIGVMGFAGCISLTSVHISEGVTSIGVMGFAGCSSLTSILIPNSVTSIGTSAFCYCPLLTSINIPESVNSIETYAFYCCSSLTSIDIPEGITNIGEGVFESCSSLTSINIPKGVTSIGNYAFSGCSSLISISSFNTTSPILPVSVFDGLPTNGTLHVKPGATGYDAWLSLLPSGWTIVEDL